MIVTRLIGGIGNQMFQYAAGRAVAYRTGQSLKLDISAFGKIDKKREYSLFPFNIIEDFATPKDIINIKVYREPHFEFDPNALNMVGNTYMIGYWQSHKYFKNISNIIKRDFTLKEEINTKILFSILTNNSVSLHVRRGDYISDEATNAFHGACSMRYYNKAIGEVGNRIKDPHFFVFSDDINWCKNEFAPNYPVTFVEKNKDFEDLYLISKCKHHIIANSAFSWWGAYLSSNLNKIVIAPGQWFNKADLDTRDLLLNRWLKL